MNTSDSVSQKLSGAYFTPEDIAASLVSWACRNSSDRMLDPACGDGRFLSFHPNCVGIEQNSKSANKAIERAPSALVHEGDFFTWASETSERFECAAGNPPFIRYQSFSGETRRRAIDFCKKLGANFNGLASSWAPFIVATAGLLKPGGRMAFVVPAEIGHAPYAAPLLEYLVGAFAKVHIVAVREKIFSELSEDCWLLFTEGIGEQAKSIDLSIVDKFVPNRKLPKPDISINLNEWRSVWNRRLRPYLLPSSIRSLYSLAKTSPDSHRFDDFAKVNIGYVSGKNSFFHLRPSEVNRWQLPKHFLQPSLRNSKEMPKSKVCKTAVETWIKDDKQVLLLKIGRNQTLPETVKKYLNSTDGKEASLGYKCRNRTPWYSIPDVKIPDFFMSYMAGRTSNLIQNVAGVTCTNSVHAVHIQNRSLAKKLINKWNSPFLQLSREIEGHALGGGMLKLEPREASAILFPSDQLLSDVPKVDVLDAVSSMQTWRHYAT